MASLQPRSRTNDSHVLRAVLKRCCSSGSVSYQLAASAIAHAGRRLRTSDASMDFPAVVVVSEYRNDPTQCFRGSAECHAGPRESLAGTVSRKSAIVGFPNAYDRCKGRLSDS